MCFVLASSPAVPRGSSISCTSAPTKSRKMVVSAERPQKPTAVWGCCSYSSSSSYGEVLAEHPPTRPPVGSPSAYALLVASCSLRLTFCPCLTQPCGVRVPLSRLVVCRSFFFARSNPPRIFILRFAFARNPPTTDRRRAWMMADRWWCSTTTSTRWRGVSASTVRCVVVRACVVARATAV